MNTFLKIFIFVILLSACKDDEIISPVIITHEPTDLDYNSVNIKAEIIEPGTEGLIKFGFVWNNTSDLDLNLNTVILDSGIMPVIYERTICDLEPGTEYFVAAYGKYDGQTVFGNTVSFQTPEFLTPQPGAGELVISSGQICGWNSFNDSVRLSEYEIYYQYFGSYDTPCYKRVVEMDPGDWQELLELFDMNEFLKIDLNDCALCVDGCDLWVRVDTWDMSHKIVIDTDRFARDSGQNMTIFRDQLPFILKVDSIRMQVYSL